MQALVWLGLDGCRGGGRRGRGRVDGWQGEQGEVSCDDGGEGLGGRQGVQERQDL